MNIYVYLLSTKMHSWGCATWDGVCADASFSQVKNLNKVQRIFDVVEKTCWLRGAAVLNSEMMACIPKSFRRRQGGAPPRVARSWDRGGAAATRFFDDKVILNLK